MFNTSEIDLKTQDQIQDESKHFISIFFCRLTTFLEHYCFRIICFSAGNTVKSVPQCQLHNIPKSSMINNSSSYKIIHTEIYVVFFLQNPLIFKYLKSFYRQPSTVELFPKLL